MIRNLAAALFLSVPVVAQDDPAAAVRARIAAVREQGDQALSRAMQDGRSLTTRAAELRIASLRFDDAARRLARAAEKDPAAGEALRAWENPLRDRRIEARVLLARSFVARGSFEAAARVVAEARKLDPADARVAELAVSLADAKKGSGAEDGSMHLGHVAGESPFPAPPRPVDHPVWDRQRAGRQAVPAPAPSPGATGATGAGASPGRGAAPAPPPARTPSAPPPFPGRR
jgi:hypothetical protein